MNIYLVKTTHHEYIGAFATEQAAKDFIANCLYPNNYIVVIDWLLGVEK